MVLAIPSYQSVDCSKEEKSDGRGCRKSAVLDLVLPGATSGAVEDFVGRVRWVADYLTARPAWSVLGTQFDSWALYLKANIRPSESTESGLHQFRGRQFGGARGLVLRSQL